MATKTICDICGNEIEWTDVCSAEYSVSEKSKDCCVPKLSVRVGLREYTLCGKCNNRVWYLLNNNLQTISDVQNMGLANRLRFLFMLPLKRKD